MIYFSLPWKNIKRLFSKNTFMTVILMVSQIAAIIVLFLAYGMTENSERDIKEQVEPQNHLSCWTDGPYTMGDVRSFLDGIIDYYGNKIESVCVDGVNREKKYTVYMRFSYLNGKPVYDEKEINYLVSQQPNHSGRYYTPEEFYQGKKVVVTSDILPECNEIFDIFGEEFEVVGHFTEGGYIGEWGQVDIPYYAAPDNMIFSSISIALKKLPTVSEYNYFATEMFNFFDNNCDVTIPEKFSNQSKDMYKTYIVIGIIMLGISIIVIGTIYSYLLKLRRKDNAVMALCGGKNRVVLVINLIEIILVCMAAYFIAVLICDILIVPKMKYLFIYFGDIFAEGVYLKFALIYFVVISITSVFYINKEFKKSVSMILKGGVQR